KEADGHRQASEATDEGTGQGDPALVGGTALGDEREHSPSVPHGSATQPAEAAPDLSNAARPIRRGLAADRGASPGGAWVGGGDHLRDLGDAAGCLLPAGSAPDPAAQDPTLAGE